MDILENVNNNRVGSYFWVNSENKKFSEIIKENITMFKEWSSTQLINNSTYSNNILKPINGYAMYFWDRPQITESNDELYLRYSTHAEIWFEKRNNGIYALDKTWQRQFYPSEIKIKVPKNFFDATYKFYIPWLIDEDVYCDIKEISDSPFKIINNKVKFNKLIKDQEWNCDWIHFLIKSEGEHVEEYSGKIYGIIPLNTPICDIIIKDKNIIDKVKREYE